LDAGRAFAAAFALGSSDSTKNIMTNGGRNFPPNSQPVPLWPFSYGFHCHFQSNPAPNWSAVRLKDNAAATEQVQVNAAKA